MEKTRAIIDYIEDGDLSNMRDALYSSIMDRVSQHIEQKKIEVAHNLLNTNEEKESGKDEDDDKKKDKKDSKKSKKDDDGDDDDDDDDDKKGKGEGKDDDGDDDDSKGNKKKSMKESASLNEAHQIGDYVSPVVGPHAGEKHRVIHSHGDGNYNITPMIPAKKIKYRLGAVRAHESQLKKWEEPKKDVKEEAEQIDEKDWIAGAIKHPGALHRELDVPAGEKIPASKLEKAAHAKGKEGRRARLALTLKGMH